MKAARASWTEAEMEGPRAEITLVTTWGIVGEEGREEEKEVSHTLSEHQISEKSEFLMKL